MRIFYEEWQCLSIGSPMANQLQQLENKIEEGVEIGEKALGFDMLAAEEVISLKVELPNLKLIAVIPYDGQNERWSAREQDRYWDILDKADDAILLSKHYFNGCLLRRNDYMLSHSCGLIAFFDGKPKGGTFYTCRKAKSMGMDIINLYKSQV